MLGSIGRKVTASHCQVGVSRVSKSGSKIWSKRILQPFHQTLPLSSIEKQSTTSLQKEGRKEPEHPEAERQKGRGKEHHRKGGREREGHSSEGEGFLSLLSALCLFLFRDLPLLGSNRSSSTTQAHCRHFFQNII